jgi:chemotaxis protein MotA
MSLGTLVGILVGIILFLQAIISSTDQYGSFLHIPSLIMVVGGTIAATFIAYNERYALQALKAVISIFSKNKVDQKTLLADVEKIISWGEIVNKGGIRELENQWDEKENENPIIKFSMEMVFMGEKSETIYKETETLVTNIHFRRMVSVDVLDTMASFAPSFGMIGTLVGLVILLNNMADPAALGAGMSVALITTLYGVLFQNLLFKPAARKVEQNNGMLNYKDMLLVEGIAMLPDKKHPIIIQNHLNSFLNPDNHFDVAGG